MPTESAKTMTYVAIAAVMALAGLFLAPTGPKAAHEGVESLIGTEFYKNFTKPSEATSIEVIGYDPTTATATPFSVEYSEGLWRIPTRNNYPADAKDRLAKVASSIIGLKREALAGRSESEQAEFQVLDPKDIKTETLKGIGNRVTLRHGNTVLADYIIGKQVPNRAGYYYVRKPDEKATFIAKVELNLSTKFTDWIESDVLNLEGNRLTHLDIMKYTLEIQRNGRGRLVDQERSVLARKNSTDPWKLEGLDEEKEEVNQDEVRKLVDSLDNLKIVGVRPKPEALRKDLKNNEGITIDDQTEGDLASRGFFFQQTPRGVQMISMEGKLTAGTDQGVEYEMHFGNVFEGTEEEIELGFAKPPVDDQPADAEKKDESKSDDDKPATGKKKSRFIFVTARVNPELFGPAHEEPVKPEPPSEEPKEEKPAATEENSDEKKPDEKADEKKAVKKPEEKKTDEKKPDEKNADDKPAEESKDDEKPKEDPKKSFEDLLKKYEADKAKYEFELSALDAKVKDADEKVKTLNARFADWYYVISAESFENLRQGRKTLVKEKPAPEKPESKTEPEEGAETKDGEAKKEDAKETPAKKDENPAAEKPKTETPKTGTPKAEPPKSGQPKAAPPKAKK